MEVANIEVTYCGFDTEPDVEDIYVIYETMTSESTYDS